MLEIDEGFWDYKMCVEYASKINGEAYCIPVEIGR
jgi:hypothetical protein|tara:strand:- start:1661 stop:1765 length:105 start_codon:yes stop_codon:yes gene_type:complete